MSVHSITQPWKISGGLAGHMAMQSARLPPGQVLGSWVGSVGPGPGVVVVVGPGGLVGFGVGGVTSPTQVRWVGRLTSRVGRPQLTKPDVHEGDGGAGVVGLHVGGHPGVGRAGAPAHPRLAGVRAQGEVPVQPQHVGVMVVPHGHDQHLAPGHALTHRLQSALLLVVVRVTKGGLLLATHRVRDGVSSLHPCDRSTMDR